MFHASSCHRLLLRAGGAGPPHGFLEDLRELLEKLGPVMKALHQRHDWREYGGAPLLGVAGYCLICHGRSDARAIKNAIRVGKQLHRSGINAKIVESVQKSIPSEQ